MTSGLLREAIGQHMLTTILGFYPETGSGPTALAHVRESGFPHSAIVYSAQSHSARTATFAATQEEEGRSHRQVILAGLLAALVASYTVFLTLSWPLEGVTLIL